MNAPASAQVPAFIVPQGASSLFSGGGHRLPVIGNGALRKRLTAGFEPGAGPIIGELRQRLRAQLRGFCEFLLTVRLQSRAVEFAERDVAGVGFACERQQFKDACRLQFADDSNLVDLAREHFG